MHLTGMHLTGMHLTGMHLTGMYLTGVHLSYTCLSHRRVSTTGHLIGASLISMLLTEAIPQACLS
jgi:uncharacterized protein YjbI with pentapeptide repeats